MATPPERRQRRAAERRQAAELRRFRKMHPEMAVATEPETVATPEVDREVLIERVELAKTRAQIEADL